MSLVQKLRKYMADEKIDYLLVNATNEFLAEYNDVNENARYFLTGFSGSVGDALLSQKDLKLFVDGRYHEQADMEAFPGVTVVHAKVGKSPAELLFSKMIKNKTFALVSSKNSQGRVEVLRRLLKEKNISLRLLDFDPVMMFLDKIVAKKPADIRFVPVEISGKSAEQKLEMISKKNTDEEAILTTNPEEVSYLCNVRDFSSNCSSQLEAKALIFKGSAVIFTNKSVENFSSKFKILPLNDFAAYSKKIGHIQTVFLDKTTITAYDYSLFEDKAGFLDENYLKRMKSVKNEAEISHMKDAFLRADKTLSTLRDFILENEASEFEIAEKLEREFKKNGALSLSFNSIVARNANSALAHYSKNSKDEIVKDGDLVLIDCGAYFEGGYATDMTRVFVKGEPSKIVKKVYTCVLKAFLAAFYKKISSKTTGFSLDKTARKLLNDAPSGFAFSHALGHGIGINVHEFPPSLSFSPLSKSVIEPNMCFTIEPGLYARGKFGVRLENSCYMHHEGDKLAIKSFSNMCFEEKLIDFSLLTPKEKKWLKNFEVK